METAYLWNISLQTLWKARITSCRALILICIQFTCGNHYFSHIKDTLCGRFRAQVTRQQSLISNALFLTFATTCHYQKGLDFPGVTFRSWVRYTVSTLHGPNGVQYHCFMKMLRKQSWRHVGGKVEWKKIHSFFRCSCII